MSHHASPLAAHVLVEEIHDQFSVGSLLLGLQLLYLTWDYWASDTKWCY